MAATWPRAVCREPTPKQQLCSSSSPVFAAQINIRLVRSIFTNRSNLLFGMSRTRAFQALQEARPLFHVSARRSSLEQRRVMAEVARSAIPDHPCRAIDIHNIGQVARSKTLGNRQLNPPFHAAFLPVVLHPVDRKLSLAPLHGAAATPFSHEEVRRAEGEAGT